VPCFEGLSPTTGANSTSPVIASGVSNFPLNVNIPGSRPTLPSGNSTAPENVTEFWSPGVHFASEGFAGPHRLSIGSSSRKVPLPRSCASKRNERLFPSAKTISTFHLPIMSVSRTDSSRGEFGDCAWAMTTQHIWANNRRIKARVVLIFFGKPSFVSGQGCLIAILPTKHPKRRQNLGDTQPARFALLSSVWCVSWAD
jgi:hypothetical protein